MADVAKERKNNRPALMESSLASISFSSCSPSRSQSYHTTIKPGKMEEEVRWLGFYGVYSNAQRVKLFQAKFNYFLLSIQPCLRNFLVYLITEILNSVEPEQIDFGAKVLTRHRHGASCISDSVTALHTCCFPWHWAQRSLFAVKRNRWARRCAGTSSLLAFNCSHLVGWFLDKSPGSGSSE